MRVLLSVIGLCCCAQLFAGEKILRVELPRAAAPYDWNFNIHGALLTYFNSVTETLYRFDATGAVKPHLASSSTCQADGKTCIIRLKPGITWSDGVPLKAQHFIDSWRRLFELGVAGANTNFFDIVQGYDAFRSGANHDPASLGIRALNDQTIEVRLKAKTHLLLETLALQFTAPIRKDLLEKFGSSAFKPGNVVVTGPWLPQTVDAQGSITLVPNPRYRHSRPFFDKLILVFESDENHATLAFKSAQLDVIAQTYSMGSDVNLAATSRASQLQFVRYILLNTQHYPMSIPKFRQALAMSIDQQLLAKALPLGAVEAATTLVPPRLLPLAGGISLPFDPARARTLLAETGLDRLKPVIELRSRDGDEQAYAMNAVADQIRKNLKLEVKVILMPAAELDPLVANMADMAYSMIWIADLPDPANFLLAPLPNRLTTRKWQNEEYNTLTREAQALPPGAEKKSKIERALKILQVDEAVVIPLFYRPSRFLISPKLEGVKLPLLGGLDFESAKLKSGL